MPLILLIGGAAARTEPQQVQHDHRAAGVLGQHPFEVGVRLPARKLHPGRLRAAAHRAIGLRAGAQRIAAAGGPTAAADVLEQLTATRR
jgi:hypothetical protein